MAAGQLGALAITVDLDFGDARVQSISRQADAVLTRLLELFDLYEVAATWAATEPAGSDALARVRETDAGHEPALLGEPTWVGLAAGRTRFAQELARRVEAATNLGITLCTLAVCHARVPREHYDLLVKHGVSVVRQERTGGGRSLAALQPQTLRHGVWEIPSAVTLPDTGAWFGKGSVAGRNAVRKAIALTGLAHITLNLAGLAAHDPRLQAVESVLRCAARAVGRGVLRTATLGRLAHEWLAPQKNAPARSILRVA